MKPRRDITLGEMQDECRRRNRDCMAHTNCEYRWYCDPILNATEFDSITPLSNDLTDPPRFNEQQMAFFRGLHGLGVAKLDTHVKNGQPTAFGVDGDIFYYDFLDGVEFPLDLAELLGKDGAE